MNLLMNIDVVYVMVSELGIDSEIGYELIRKV
jgi:hypothetical protein